ncbi:unnamed protein product [Paramecium pentaurelia]|uniref:Protein kinase domain-containing protein n=1 Tax=Paramecium pentaurelia TaxID=43138 RepID=A0A8S1T6C1_9CILI|nr:unnamed protein product [Paramecium pentaurelia]
MHHKLVVLQEIRPNKVYLVKYQNQDKGQFYLKKYLAYQYQNIVEVVKILKGQQLRNIVKIIDVSIENNELLCVVEEACKYNLREIIKLHETTFDTQEILKCLLDIIGGLLELKNLNIFHRDIKPDNIVYDGENYKIIDFETAKKFQDDRTKVQSLDIGTLNYRAPEITQNRAYSSQCDVWSLGCLFYYMLFKQERNHMDQLVIPQNHNYDDQIIKILERMLEKNEKKRITLANLQNDVQQLYNINNNQTQSTRLEQNTINLVSDINKNINEIHNDINTFNNIMTNLIIKEKNEQKIIKLYQFWTKRLGTIFPLKIKERQTIENLLLFQIQEFKQKRIKIDLFASIDQIKDELNCIQDLNDYYDF